MYVKCTIIQPDQLILTFQGILCYDVTYKSRYKRGAQVKEVSQTSTEIKFEKILQNLTLVYSCSSSLDLVESSVAVVKIFGSDDNRHLLTVHTNVLFLLKF
jgi:hypothetical protein